MSLVIKSVDYNREMDGIQAIRIAVFQEEQGVDPALEFDEYDSMATHLLAYLGEEAVGTVRFRYIPNHQAKIERLAVLKKARGQGIGFQLMEAAIHSIQQQSACKTIVIHAQAYVKELYEKLGFLVVSEPFDEAGILHVKMIKTLN